jgi:hypothetical protein
MYAMTMVQLKIVCFLGHDDIKPLFQVCKELGNTVRSVVSVSRWWSHSHAICVYTLLHC